VVVPPTCRLDFGTAICTATAISSVMSFTIAAESRQTMALGARRDTARMSG